ncbi:MAG TPA: hypothetical protein VEC57_10050 [Candidatus Limnocylindrales bacterium]|nr:hypothetical protein [Candidatus Limnocylindrales bacterium]
MKRGLLSCTMAAALCSIASVAFAGAYGEEETTETPAAAPAPPPAAAAEVQEEVKVDVLRRWAAFSTDGETSRGLWIEAGLIHAHEEFLQDKPGEGEHDQISSFLRVAYGQELWEAGAEVSYDWFRQEFDTALGDVEFDDNGFGDLEVWGKVIPLRTEYVNAGAGMIVSMPTGEADFRGFQTYRGSFTTDEWGFDPFVTAGISAGPLDIRMSVGYQIYTSFNDYDGLDYNFALLLPIGDMIVFRNEFDGFHFSDDLRGTIYANHDDVLDWVPGFDIRFPVGGSELLIRPTGTVGLTADSRDWGLGISFAFTGLGG